MSNNLVIKEKIKMTGLRSIIAKRMKESLENYPQSGGFTKIDMTGLIDYKDELKKDGNNVTITALLIKIIALSLKKVPILNSHQIGDEVVVYENINVGVAVPMPQGLFVLNVKDVQAKSVVEISKELKELTNQLKNGTIRLDDMTGSTITMSSVGMYEVDGFRPILNIPETVILGFGKTRKELIVNEDDTTSIHQVSTLSNSFNHAVVDGEPILRFIEEIIKILKHPKDYL